MDLQDSVQRSLQNPAESKTWEATCRYTLAVSHLTKNGK